ncbi:MAG: type II toxin-antitoxin system VapC family toxin [Burkholderiales bacterium]|nr:type II toxin-antitoxin system VapC family toxin [Burkholderiales bacterium]
MRYLLDTHAAIWALEDINKLSRAAAAVVEDTACLLFISIASAWEIAIKISIGKLDFAGGCANFIAQMEQNGIIVLPITGKHLQGVETLPAIHRDPFDRLLIATAQSENLTIISADENFQKYNIRCVW